MATLLLTSVGTILGGPLGGALGALAGKQIDSAFFGAGSGEGPRLRELSVTTSSYGQPIARHFGVMRAPGTIIWSTDLAESKETAGGGKGKPKTTSYSYSASFAVALGSRPIDGIGRIWADGNLLRGASGDLKTGGALRIYLGRGDQPVDPLISQAEQGNCPAFRGCAYVVFEDLQLGDFGNRIPALTFEVIADTVPLVDLARLSHGSGATVMQGSLDHMLGFSDEGGPLRSTLLAIDQLYPMICVTGPAGVELSQTYSTTDEPPLLPQAIAPDLSANSATDSGQGRDRQAAGQEEPSALRYYDRDRDYQLGVQRATGLRGAGRERMIDMPATYVASGARALGTAKAQRASWQRERLIWQIAELDPALAPGMIVRVPNNPGLWQIAGWEWMERGIELVLERLPPATGADLAGSPGAILPPSDTAPWPTRLFAFELPAQSLASADTPSLFVAASAGGSNWSGASLYVDRAGTLDPIGQTGSGRSILGHTATALKGSTAIAFDDGASFEVELAADDLELPSTTIEGLAAGANRLLVRDEVLQYLTAERVTSAVWRLSGLLRGRGGTEPAAMRGHQIAVPVILIDETLVALDPQHVPASTGTEIAAIGFADDEPVYAQLASPGVSRRPLAPVHPRLSVDVSGNWTCRWTRRARGAWVWHDYVETPLVEQFESYLVGVGDPDAPVTSWTVAAPTIGIDSTTIADLTDTMPGAEIWVRQIGTFGRSNPTLIAKLP